MALISTLPNFFALASPTSSSFNTAAKAIIQQLGGTYYDEGSVAYASVPGNLDSTNLASTASFKNSQKAESNSFTSTSLPAVVSAGAFASVPFFGPFLCDMVIVAINLVASAGDYYVYGGAISLYLNADPLRTISMGGGGGSTLAGANGESTCSAVAIPIRMGDFLIVDPTDPIDSPANPLLFANAARVQGVIPTSVSPTSNLVVTLHAISVHARE